MIQPIFKREWRTQNRTKRLIYSKYMIWLERAGYLFSIVLFTLFAGAFFYKFDDYVAAESVAITPATSNITTPAQTLVLQTWPTDFKQVQKGDPLFVVVQGEDAIRAYTLWEAVQASQKAGDPNVRSLNLAKPATIIVRAPLSGVFRLEAKAGDTVKEKAELGKIVDYSKLQLQGSFKGDTIGDAKVGETAQISGITVEAVGNTLVRASTAEGNLLSRSIAADSVRSAIEEQLKGKTVQLRNDIPLKVDSVSSVEVDTDLQGQKVSASGQVLDPPADFRLTGTVIQGAHSAEIQIAVLPDAARQAATNALRQTLQQKTLSTTDGKSLQVTSIGDPKYLVKAKATYAAGSAAAELKGSSLSRSFDGTVQIDSPPQFLIDEVRRADMAGKAVTAKVEIKTGSRPIAFTLLRKS